MLRKEFSEALKTAMKAKDERTISTVRLILAALKDRDIAARAKGNTEGIGEDDIRLLLQAMIKQRGESIGLYERGGRLDLAEQEREEIRVIERFLPAPMSDEEMTGAIRDIIGAIGAKGLKDMGRIMAALRQKYPGRMDLAKANAKVKEILG